MAKGSETRQVLDWILTEIGAGMCLFPESTEERTWNHAHERCKSIINNYRDGIGLFQMTAKKKQKEARTPEMTHGNAEGATE